MTVDCFGFGVGWFGVAGSGSFQLHQILPQYVSCSSFGEAGFEALDSAASIWQLLSGGISYTILMLEPTSITNTAECSAAKPDVEKAAGLFAALSNRHGNLPI